MILEMICISAKQITSRVTADKQFTVTCVEEADLKWEGCVGICTDEAQALAGKLGGLQELIKCVSPNVQWIHCMIHREALTSKQLSPKLSDGHHCQRELHPNTTCQSLDIFCTVWGTGLRPHSCFVSQQTLQWWSRGKVDFSIFLEEEGNELALMLKKIKFLMKSVYLSKMFQKLKEPSL